MTKHMRGVHVAQVPMRAMLAMAVSIVSVLLSLLPAHTANALPLGVDKLLSPVVSPLLPGAKNQPTQPNSNNSSNAGTTPAASQSQGAANQSSAASPVGSENGSVPIVENIEPLEPVAPIDISDIKQPLIPLAYLASAKREAVPSVTVARATTVVAPPIQATEEGWRLFGIAWYWWLLAIGTFIYVGRWFILRKRHSVLASV